MSHSNKECEIWLANKETLSPDQQEYGAWLRASPYNAGKISFTTVSGMGDGFGRSRSGSSALRKSQVQADTSQQKVSDELSDQSQGGDMPVTKPAFPKSACSVSTTNLPQSINQDVTKLNKVTDANGNSPAVHDQLRSIESQLKVAGTEIKEADTHNNSSSNIDSKTNMLPSITELNGDISGDNYEGLQASHSTCLPPPRTWKKISRDISPSESLMLNITPGKRNREESEEPQSEQSNKKLQLVKDHGYENSMVEAAVQPHQFQ